MASLSQAHSAEPLAIIGLACRLPGGVDTPEAFWSLLSRGERAIREVAKTGRTWSWPEDSAEVPPYAALLEQVDQFDAPFFHISPKEAVALDPQQRLLLEVSWEALEHAGINPESLRGSDTGVFVGIFSNDYQMLQIKQNDAPHLYGSTGTSAATASGRLSYFLGLQGPAISIDTASSSSLVAFHLACQSLQHGECQMALASGVNLILAPDLTLAFAHAGMLSPDGRSTGFDAAANGYVRGEGCGVVVLKRLSDAQRDGDNILAVVRGTAINQDGASQGLTAPNGASQEAVIRKALAVAGLPPAAVSYIEAHGSGTPVGDPIEGRALQAVYGQGRQTPWLLGSVKANIGHLEAAAGIAGVLKTTLALHHRYIPPHLNFHQLNPKLTGLQAEFPTTGRPWPAENGQPRRAGVSSFGFSGTNAHIILEEAPLEQTSIDHPRQRLSYNLLPLSAKNEQSLRCLAERYVNYLAAHPDLSLADVSYTASTGRAHFEYRLAAVAESPAELQAQLRAFLADESAPGLASGLVHSRQKTKVAFLFTGGGAQYVNMGRELFETQPLFRQLLIQCDEILRPHLETPLLEVLYPAAEAASPLDEMRYMQPALFAIEYALAKLWQSWGIQPEVVIGHSLGEYVAACVAGVFSLEDGLKLVAKRGQLMDTTAAGEMVALEANEEEIRAALSDFTEAVSIAVVNEARNTVLSGQPQAIQAVLARLPHIKATKLNITCASHSPLMEPIMAEFAAAARQVAFAPPQIPLVSNNLAALADERIMSPDYWSRHLRDTVRFGAGIEVVQQQGVQVFIEIGPKPILLGVSQNHLYSLARGASPYAAEGPENTAWLPSLRPNFSDRRTLGESLAELYVRGFSLGEADFAQATNRLALPTYAFQRQRYWLASTAAHALAGGQGRSSHNGQHNGLSQPRAKQKLAVANDPAIRFGFDLSPVLFPYLNHHRIFGRALLSAGLYFEFVLTCGRELLNSRRLSLENVTLQQSLQLPEEPTALRTMQVVLAPEDSDVLACQVLSVAENSAGETAWISHASGRLRLAEEEAAERLLSLSQAGIDLATLRQRCPEEIAVEAYYAQVSAWNLTYRLTEDGMDEALHYQLLQSLWRGTGVALGLVHLPPTLYNEAEALALHPLLLDGGIQVAQATFASALCANNETYLPVGLNRLHLFRSVVGDVWAYARLEEETPTLIKTEVVLLDEQGLIAQLEGLTFQRTTREALLRPAVIGSPTTRASQGKLLAQLTQTSLDQQQTLLQEYVQNQVRRVLGLRATEALSSQHSFKELGLDSLMSANLRSSFERDLKVMLPLERLLQADSTVPSLVRFLSDKVVPTAAAAAVPVIHTNGKAHTPDVSHPEDFHDAAAVIPQIHAIVTAQEGRKVKVADRWVFDFASCNYLGLDLHPEVMDAIMPAIRKWGVHPSWTRAVASPGIYEELEQSLADLMGVYSTLVFPAVTLLHAGVIPVLAGPEGVIFKDISAHRSIDEACRLAQTEGAEVVVFKHNDPVDLEQRLAQYPLERTKLIAIDGVYSMSGAYAVLPELARLAKQYNATVYMDDAHGMGVIGEKPSSTKPYGCKGNGIVNHFGLDYAADRLVYVAGLSKSYSSFGAFVTCTDEAIKNKLRSASTFIFSGPSPTASLASALAGIQLNQREGETWRAQIYHLTHRLITGAKALGYEVINDNYFPIVCVVIGKTSEVIEACQILWQYGILITPALFPIVPKDKGLLRFSITAANTEEEIDRSLEAMAAVRERL
jgi:acyl transferase domain-containing protein/7-keto-8-aminopelargonate synthetase-like enzyme